jgi:hypothetical protein
MELLDKTEGTDAASDDTRTKSINQKFLRIVVKDDDKTRVNINIPLALAEVGLKLIPKDKLNIDGTHINVDDIIDLIKAGQEGSLVDIETSENGKPVSVRIFVD